MNRSTADVLRRLEKQSTLEKTRKIDVKLDDRMLAITKETGELFNMILRLKNARNMLEIGTSVGYSTIWCAEAIQKNSGKIITIEKNMHKISKAKENFLKAKVSDTIEIKEGTALEILNEMNIQGKFKNYFDFILIDADKENTIEYFDAVIPMTSIRGVIITDNMLYPKKYRKLMKKLSDHIKKNPNMLTITTPIGNGEEITIKLK